MPNVYETGSELLET